MRSSKQKKRKVWEHGDGQERSEQELKEWDQKQNGKGEDAQSAKSGNSFRSANSSDSRFGYDLGATVCCTTFGRQERGAR